MNDLEFKMPMWATNMMTSNCTMLSIQLFLHDPREMKHHRGDINSVQKRGCWNMGWKMLKGKNLWWDVRNDRLRFDFMTYVFAVLLELDNIKQTKLFWAICSDCKIKLPPRLPPFIGSESRCRHLLPYVSPHCKVLVLSQWDSWDWL